jgi:hypothetical protein
MSVEGRHASGPIQPHADRPRRVTPPNAASPPPGCAKQARRPPQGRAVTTETHAPRKTAVATGLAPAPPRLPAARGHVSARAFAIRRRGHAALRSRWGTTRPAMTATSARRTTVVVWAVAYREPRRPAAPPSRAPAPCAIPSAVPAKRQRQYPTEPRATTRTFVPPSAPASRACAPAASERRAAQAAPAVKAGRAIHSRANVWPVQSRTGAPATTAILAPSTIHA